MTTATAAPELRQLRPPPHPTILAAGVFLLTLATFWPVVRCGFVNYDDPLYVTENPHVQQGISWDGVRWAFGHSHAGNYQPLTYVSLMLDRTLWGTSATGFHATNLVIHAIDAALLLLVISTLTGSTLRAALVAALFAVHPLRVESVAWACERKDVLSALFGIVSIAAYVRYARRPGVGGLALVAVAFALSLMCKSTWITLPAVLMLLDFWPMRRVQIPTDYSRGAGFPRRPIPALLCEKLPLLGLSIASAIATLAAQRAGDALGTTEQYPMVTRLANALVAYVRYLEKVIWPANLAVFYPQTPLAASLVVFAMILLIALTIAAILRWNRSPALTIGWLWFLGALVPMIGLVQSGAQAMADRFTYFPIIGLMIAIVWVLPRKPVTFAAAGVVVLALALTTRAQISHWRDSAALFEHALAVTGDNHVAHNNLAIELTRLGKTDEARRHYVEAIRIRPNYSTAHNGLGVLLAREGDAAGAIREYELALAANPTYALAHRNLATQLIAAGREPEALPHLIRAVELRPTDARARDLLGIQLARRGDFRAAVAQFDAAAGAAMPLQPDLAAEANFHAGEVLARAGDLEAAAVRFREVLRLKPGDRDARSALDQIGAHQRSASAAGD